MTQLVILSSIEHRKFDSPPVLTSDNRALYFSLTSKEKKFIQKLRTATNKAGFLLQLGYFKANAKFYTADQFRRPDIEYVSKILGIPFNKINFSTYQKKIPTDHRKRILKILGWKDFNKSQRSEDLKI